MKTIKLTQGFVTLVDDEDYEKLSTYPWFYKDGYAATNTGTYKRSTLRMHQILRPVLPPFFVDHENRNTLDNQKHNLRVVTASLNGQNVMRKDNTSGFKGVSLFKKTGRWRATYTFEKKNYCLGHFFEAIDAAKAYDAKMKELYRDKALTNEKLGLY